MRRSTVNSNRIQQTSSHGSPMPRAPMTSYASCIEGARAETKNSPGRRAARDSQSGRGRGVSAPGSAFCSPQA
eukprot:11220288-Lingulodinium_polyedra.AAC.1